MPENKTKQKLNPEVANIEIGVRYLRNVTFYPLSAADQLKMTTILESIFGELVKIDKGEGNEESLVVFFSKVLTIVKENITLIIGMICDEDAEEVLKDLTNSQLVKVVEYVYKTNFEGPLKNLLTLFQKEGENMELKELLSNQLLQQSAKSTDTVSKTSTEKATKKVA